MTYTWDGHFRPYGDSVLMGDLYMEWLIREYTWYASDSAGQPPTLCTLQIHLLTYKFIVSIKVSVLVNCTTLKHYVLGTTADNQLFRNILNNVLQTLLPPPAVQNYNLRHRTITGSFWSTRHISLTAILLYVCSFMKVIDCILLHFKLTTFIIQLSYNYDFATYTVKPGNDC